MDVCVISARGAFWEHLLPEFVGSGLRPVVLDSLDTGLERIASCPPVAVILDLLAGADKEAHIRELRAAFFSLLRVNASVHAAAVSSLSDEDFHDVFEGFGLLCSLPVTPEASDVRRFAESLRRVTDSVRAAQKV